MEVSDPAELAEEADACFDDEDPMDTFKAGLMAANELWRMSATSKYQGVPLYYFHADHDGVTYVLVGKDEDEVVERVRALTTGGI